MAALLPTFLISLSLSLSLSLSPISNPFGDVSTKAKIHLWDAHDKVVVTDIDGTITKSDVIGYIDTVQLGKYDYTHQGICRLYSHLETNHQIRFVYLTSRPISLLDATRTYIEKCEQDGHRLPVGPIFTSTDSLTRVLYKELIEKTIRYFKAHTLMDIATVFQRAGRDPDMSVFLFGFGNKVADGQAYAAAGLHPDNIFIINPYSDIRVFGYEADGLGAGRGTAESISSPSLSSQTVKQDPEKKQQQQQQQQQVTTATLQNGAVVDGGIGEGGLVDKEKVQAVPVTTNGDGGPLEQAQQELLLQQQEQAAVEKINGGGGGSNNVPPPPPPASSSPWRFSPSRKRQPPLVDPNAPPTFMSYSDEKL